MAKRSLQWELLINPRPASVENWRTAWNGSTEKQKLKFCYQVLQVCEPGEYGKDWRVRRAQKVGTFIWMINQHQDKDAWWGFINQSTPNQRLTS